MKRKVDENEKYIKKVQYNNSLIVKDVVKYINLKKYNIAKNIVCKYNINIDEIYKYIKSKNELVQLFGEKEYNFIIKTKKKELKNSKFHLGFYTFFSIFFMILSTVTICFPKTFSMLFSAVTIAITLLTNLCLVNSYSFYKEDKSNILSYQDKIS